MTTATTFTTSNSMKKIIMFGTDDDFKSDNVLDFMTLYANYLIYSCRYEQIKPQLCAFRKELKKRYETEASTKSSN